MCGQVNDKMRVYATSEDFMMESTIMYYTGSPGITRKLNLQLRKMQWVITYDFSDEKKGWIASREKRTFDGVEVLVPPAFVDMKVPSFSFLYPTLPSH